MMIRQQKPYHDQTRHSLTQNLEGWTTPIKQNLTGFAYKMLTEQLVIAKKNSYEVRKVRNDYCVGRYECNVTEMCCNCGWIGARGLTCRHLMYIESRAIEYQPTGDSLR